jgi:hypothetical protein
MPVLVRDAVQEVCACAMVVVVVMVVVGWGVTERPAGRFQGVVLNTSNERAT